MDFHIQQDPKDSSELAGGGVIGASGGYGSVIIIIRTTMNWNRAPHGGVFDLKNCRLTVVDSVMSFNSAQLVSGDGASVPVGGVILASAVMLNIVSTTLEGNAATVSEPKLPVASSNAITVDEYAKSNENKGDGTRQMFEEVVLMV
ncbi:hypothetical protein CYMTET_26784 [Cymbomonas tetramitiformis]|uniref:Uncharacterized protein n=1 Tax=Cymbomonas tetramitiformis TaxID=36881 RepID=A0AAE0FR38_9CHLO|nr:hypothetical protein CYMTET_26784 [Cymbomonas tetramitiformis]